MSILRKHRGEHGGALSKLIAALCVVALCVLVYFARHPIMRLAAEWWVVDQPAAHADALVVLGDDNFYGDRASRATELYRHGVAPILVASGRRLRPKVGISELIQHDLAVRGVPEDKIVRLVQDADSTREEAEAVSKLAGERGWQSLVVVTSNYHARRARYIFSKVLPGDISLSVAGAKDGDFDPEDWWAKRKSTKLFARELLGFLEAAWELRGEEKGKTGAERAVEEGVLKWPWP